MTKPTSGIGAIFNRWDGSEWIKIAKVRSIDGPDMSRETIDVTTLDSTGGYREFIGSLRDGGNVSIPMIFTVSGYTEMKTDFEGENLNTYQIVLPDEDNTTLKFEGLVTDLPLSVPLDDVISCDVTIKVSGQTTLSGVDIVSSVDAIDDISADNGTQLADVGLPTTVDVTFSDDSPGTIDVVWDTGTPMYDGGTAGTYTFTGRLVMGEGELNPLRLTASVDVVVGV